MNDHCILIYFKQLNMRVIKCKVSCILIFKIKTAKKYSVSKLKVLIPIVSASWLLFKNHPNEWNESGKCDLISFQKTLKLAVKSEK